jgi:hypothetical protein
LTDAKPGPAPGFFAFTSAFLERQDKRLTTVISL